MSKQILSIAQILSDLENGFTRTNKAKNYNSEVGCIQDKYELSDYDLEQMFKHPDLKGRKTKVIKVTSFVWASEIEEVVPTTTVEGNDIIISEEDLSAEVVEEVEEEEVVEMKGWS